ncbi:MAG TPA: CPBP family intramembrane glutamic endopeptidase [Nocardioides sp.]|jgi:membrane protease YdiL (CAAX protease family)|nr:CPBP family intramembrane glutamic endopeptidase [Nocardioides sp.]
MTSTVVPHPARPVLPGSVPVGSARGGAWWRALALAEVLLACVVVVRDLLLPAAVLVLLAGASLWVRRERVASLGLVGPRQLSRLVPAVLGLSVAWTLLEVALVIPVTEHVTGQRQDMAGFAELHGNLGLLVVLLVASWTLAAFVEELAFRGYLRTRLVDVLGGTPTAAVAASLVAALMFGLIHTEQGVVGVVLTTVDALFFTVLARRSASGLWASVLAHGFNNTIGLVTVFLVGPVYGLW